MLLRTAKRRWNRLKQLVPPKFHQFPTVSNTPSSLCTTMTAWLIDLTATDSRLRFACRAFRGCALKSLWPKNRVCLCRESILISESSGLSVGNLFYIIYIRKCFLCHVTLPFGLNENNDPFSTLLPRGFTYASFGAPVTYCHIFPIKQICILMKYVCLFLFLELPQRGFGEPLAQNSWSALGKTKNISRLSRVKDRRLIPLDYQHVSDARRLGVFLASSLHTIFLLS